MKKILYGFIALSAVFVLWVGISFIDISIHNDPFSDGYKDYLDWNFFTVFSDYE